MHGELLKEFKLAKDEVSIILFLSYLSAMMPISLFMKVAFARLVGRAFIITPANAIDMAIFVLCAFL